MPTREEPRFEVTCPRGLAGYIVTPEGTRGVLIASKEEGHLSLDAALRRGRLTEDSVRMIRASLDASTLVERIEDLRPKFRLLTVLLNTEGVGGIGVNNVTGQLFAACYIPTPDSVRIKIAELASRTMPPEEVRAFVEKDDFDLSIAHESIEEYEVVYFKAA